MTLTHQPVGAAASSAPGWPDAKPEAVLATMRGLGTSHKLAAWTTGTASSGQACSSRVTPSSTPVYGPREQKAGAQPTPVTQLPSSTSHAAENTAVSFTGDRLALRCPSTHRAGLGTQREPRSTPGERRRSPRTHRGSVSCGPSHAVFRTAEGFPAPPQELSCSCPRVCAARTWRLRPH